MTKEEEFVARQLYSLEDKYRDMLSDRIEIDKDTYGYNRNDIFIFPEWYFYESNKTRISFLNKALEKGLFIQELDEAIDFETGFKEEQRNRDVSKKVK